MRLAEKFDSFEEHVEWMVEKYENEKWSTLKIANEFDGLSHGQVNRRLKNAGVDIRDSTDYKHTNEGGANPMADPADYERDPLHEARKGVPEWCNDWRVHIGWLVGRWEEGPSMGDLADDLGVSRSTVRERMHETGFKADGYSETGEDHPLYEGGDAWRANKRWRRFRQKVLNRDGRACQDCGREPQKPHVHHIEPVSEGGDKYDLDNLVTLCGSCHSIRHG